MSGLFSRLASQALGQTPALRSSVTNPYAPLPVRVEGATDSTGMTAPVEPPRAATRVKGDAAEPASVHHAEDRRIALAEAPAAIVAQEVTRPDANAAAAEAPRPFVKMQPRARASRRAPPARVAAAIPTADDAATATPSPDPDRGPDAAAGERPDPSRPETRRWLLPPRVPLPPARPAVTDASAGRRPADGDEPVEVHVHIGNIELTAIPAPTPPRPRPTRPSGALSLDEYLARRAERRA